MQEDTLNDIRYEFYKYVFSPSYAGFLERRYTHFGWKRLFIQWGICREIKQTRVIAEALSIDGQFLIGVILTANTNLYEEQVSPALILATFDTSAQGFKDLLSTANIIHSAENTVDEAILVPE